MPCSVVVFFVAQETYAWAMECAGLLLRNEYWSRGNSSYFIWHFQGFILRIVGYFYCCLCSIPLMAGIPAELGGCGEFHYIQYDLGPILSQVHQSSLHHAVYSHIELVFKRFSRGLRMIFKCLGTKRVLNCIPHYHTFLK